MAETLTAQQRMAVENRGGKLLVSAAAGSGKTKVLVDRLMGYILDPVNPANIDDFLIITYTKAAAGELRGKIAAKLSEKMAENVSNRHLQKQMQRLYLAKISTVHGFCTDILRQYAYRLDIAADFRVADESECLELQRVALENVLDSAYETASADPDFCAFVDSQGLGRDDRQIPEIILKVYNSSRCHLNPDQWRQWCVSCDSNSLTDAGQTPWGKYLIKDLMQYLDLHMEAMNNCISAATNVDGMEKPVALFAETVSQLQAIRACNTWNEVVCCREIDYGRLTFSKKCTDTQLMEQMKAVRKACKDGLARRMRLFVDDSEQLLSDIAVSSAATRGLIALVKRFAAEYDRIKRHRGVLDFGDLEHRTLDLFLGKQRSGITSVANEVGERFREVMVDEYQDSNGIQDAIFSALTQKKQNCFMVGDVKQSIYQFRLADPGIFIEKYNTYQPACEAAPGEGRKVMLTHNFRSSGGVISAVNDVFSQCMSPGVGGLIYGEEEMLREGISHIPLPEPEVSLFGIEVENDTYAEEASFVADKIVSLLDGKHYVRNGEQLRPITPEDIVILLRSPGSVGGEFQFALQTRGIRCITGDPTDLLQAEEISTVRAILQVLDNPLQDIPLVAALTSPVFGFTAEDLSCLRSADRQASIYQLLTASADAKCEKFVSILNKLRQTARTSTVTQLLSEIYTQTNLLAVYSASAEGGARLDNLQAFFQLASDYESCGPVELPRFLAYLEAASERGLRNAGAAKDRDAVTIMSIHKSKGLEFPVVFLCGLSRGFNQESLRSQVLCDKDLGLGLDCTDSKLRVRYPTIAKRSIRVKMMRESISEEMRVLYVAMTRARDKLIMTYASKSLDTDLREFANRIDLSNSRLLAMEADCPGTWVLQSAMSGTDAGAFFALGGKPDHTRVRECPWEIAVVNATVREASYDGVSDTEAAISQEMLKRLSATLSYTYSHSTATTIPSKLTATQLKGRILDTEIDDGSRSSTPMVFRKPEINSAISGRTYGNAVHSVLQYLRFSACGSAESIRQEVAHLVQEHLISPEDAALVNCEKLAVFFATPLGRRLQGSKEVLREFKFSILDDASKYYPGAAGEQILLQGVVDCALIEEDGITVVDFKTDYVTEDTLPAVAEKYSAQVKAYADALTRIYQKPVKSALLYFFALDRFVDVI